MAPINIIVPFSMCGSKISWMFLLSLWTSSIIKINESLRLASNIALSISFLLQITAFKILYFMFNVFAMIVAIVVLPVPGFP